MPIAMSLNTFKSAFTSAYNLAQAGKASSIAGVMLSGLVSGVPAGLFPPGPAPVPLAPSGASGTKSMLEQACSLGTAADPKMVAQLMATGISQLVPNVPPIGLVKLQSDLEKSITLGASSSANMIGLLQATAVVNYYMAGGVI